MCSEKIFLENMTICGVFLDLQKPLKNSEGLSLVGLQVFQIFQMSDRTDLQTY